MFTSNYRKIRIAEKTKNHYLCKIFQQLTHSFVEKHYILNNLVKFTIMEIKDNELLRQFEIQSPTGLVAIEYSIQERKLFLTKFCCNENQDEALQEAFITNVLKIAEERKLKVVPTHAKFISFFRKNRKFQEMLPPGIKV